MKHEIFFSRTEIKSGDAGTFEGYACHYGEIPSHQSIVSKGAFDKVMDEGQVPKMFFEHRTWGQIPVGRWDSLSVDDTGLYVHGSLNLELKQAQDIYSAMKFGSIDAMSIGFSIAEGGYEVDENDWLRINQIDQLAEISIVCYPADPQARVSDVHSADINLLENIRDCERYLRESGFSRRQSQHLIAVIKNASDESVRDSHDTAEAQEMADLLAIRNKLTQMIRR